MAYVSPVIMELGSVEDLTLGQIQWGPERDTFQFWGHSFPDPWGDPSVGS